MDIAHCSYPVLQQCSSITYRILVCVLNKLSFKLNCIFSCCQGWKKECVVQQNMDGSRVVVVMPDDKLGMKKVYYLNLFMWITMFNL